MSYPPNMKRLALLLLMVVGSSCRQLERSTTATPSPPSSFNDANNNNNNNNEAPIFSQFSSLNENGKMATTKQGNGRSSTVAPLKISSIDATSKVSAPSSAPSSNYDEDVVQPIEYAPAPISSPLPSPSAPSQQQQQQQQQTTSYDQQSELPASQIDYGQPEPLVYGQKQVTSRPPVATLAPPPLVQPVYIPPEAPQPTCYHPEVTTPSSIVVPLAPSQPLYVEPEVPQTIYVQPEAPPPTYTPPQPAPQQQPIYVQPEVPSTYSPPQQPIYVQPEAPTYTQPPPAQPIYVQPEVPQPIYAPQPPALPSPVYTPSQPQRQPIYVQPEVQPPPPPTYTPPQPGPQQPTYVQPEVPSTYSPPQQPIYVQPEVPSPQPPPPPPPPQQQQSIYVQPEASPLPPTYSAPIPYRQQQQQALNYGSPAQTPVRQQTVVPLFSPPDTLTYGQLQGLSRAPVNQDQKILKQLSTQDETYNGGGSSPPSALNTYNRPQAPSYNQPPPSSNYNGPDNIPDVIDVRIQPQTLITSSGAPQDSHGNQFNIDLRSQPVRQSQPDIIYGTSQPVLQDQSYSITNEPQQSPDVGNSYGSNIPQVPSQPPPPRQSNPYSVSLPQSQTPSRDSYANNNQNQAAPQQGSYNGPNQVPSRDSYANNQNQAAPQQGSYNGPNQTPSRDFYGNLQNQQVPPQGSYGNQFDFEPDTNLAPAVQGSYGGSGGGNNEISQSVPQRDSGYGDQQGFDGGNQDSFGGNQDSYGGPPPPPPSAAAPQQEAYGNFDAVSLGILDGEFPQRPKSRGRGVGYGK